MRNRITFLVLVPLLILGCQSNQPPQPSIPQGIVLEERKEASQDGTLVIPFAKYKLDNGLTIILHEDHSDPLVHVDVTYHVGSSREKLGRSGFAHFFEHMMFQGSKHVADEEHFKIINEAGGDLNGSTSSDLTNYYQTVPSNQLEKVLWLESDRMGYLLDAVTEEKFEVQRATVKNERAQNVDNRPYGLLSERTSEALYPHGHPYSWPIIGYVDDLDAAQLFELKGFFNQWYGPNNAVLTIGGDIDVAKTLSWVKQYFGPISPSQSIQKLTKTPVTLQEDKYITIEDNVHLPLLQVTFPTVHIRHEDEAPLDVLSDILGGGKNSLFYKNLVKTGRAVNAVVSHPCRELACEFQLFALPNPTQSSSLTEITKIVLETLDEFEQRGVSEDDLNRTKATIESGNIYGLESVSGKVSQLARNEILFSEPDQIQFDLDRYQGVTQEDVMGVYRKYIKGKAAVYTSVVPKGQKALQVAEGNFTRKTYAQDNYKASEFVRSANLEDTFDRSTLPQAGATPAVKVPSFWTEKMLENIEVIGHQTSEIPTVSMIISMEGGPLLEPVSKAGLAVLTASLMNESTSKTSAEDLSNQLALLGSTVHFSAGGRSTQIRVRSLAKYLPQTMALLEEKLRFPALDAAEFKLAQERLLQNIQQNGKDAEALAELASGIILYGENNRVSLPDSGILESVNALTIEDVRDFYQRFYTSAKMSVVVVGDLDKSSALQHLSFVQTLPDVDYIIPAYEAFPQLANNALFFVSKPGATQTVVKMVKPSLPYDATGEQFHAKLMNYPLGGNFNSRVNLNLREDKGYTYGAYTGFLGGKTLGLFSVNAAVSPEHTGASISEFLDELNGMRNVGMTNDELRSMQSAYTQSDALEYETSSDKARFLQQLQLYNLPVDYPQQQLQLINQATTDTLNVLAKKWLTAEDLQIIVVGDEEQVMPQLEELNRNIQKLDL